LDPDQDTRLKRDRIPQINGYEEDPEPQIAKKTLTTSGMLMGRSGSSAFLTTGSRIRDMVGTYWMKKSGSRIRHPGCTSRIIFPRA
jgi:hypothetical protein